MTTSGAKRNGGDCDAVFKPHTQTRTHPHKPAQTAHHGLLLPPAQTAHTPLGVCGCAGVRPAVRVVLTQTSPIALILPTLPISSGRFAVHLKPPPARMALSRAEDIRRCVSLGPPRNSHFLCALGGVADTLSALA